MNSSKFFSKATFTMTVSLLFCLPFFSTAQSEARKAAISEKLDQFFQATQEKDWDKVLDLTYPKLFKLVPREQMLGLFENMAAEGMTFEMSEMKINNIYGAEDFEAETFTAVDYAMQLKIILDGESFNDQALDFMKTSFETTYGAEQVATDRENKTFTIQAEKTLFAIADKGTDNWHFIEKNAEQMMVLEQIIDQQVLEKFE